MLMPKRVKRRKQFRGSMAGKASRGTAPVPADSGLYRRHSRPRR